MTRRLPRLLRALGLLWALTLALAAGVAGAHELSMAELELLETARGEFLWQWTAAERGTQGLVPSWPEGCRAEGQVLRCGERGLRGRLGIEGVGQRYSAAMVKVFWAEGGARVYTLTRGQPTVQIHGAAEDARGRGEIAAAYGALGVEHILGGADHLLFVLALLFLVGFRRRLVGTVTAFTLAHSLTLASSALGWLRLRPTPVEALIALSIVLVAAEALHQRATLSRRWPALVAFLFGLVHGLGFAGALQQIGLPQQHLVVALLCFNLGVEAGQLLVVAGAWVALRGLSRWPRLAGARAPALYAMGSVAAWWSIGRVLAILA